MFDLSQCLPATKLWGSYQGLYWKKWAYRMISASWAVIKYLDPLFCPFVAWRGKKANKDFTAKKIVFFSPRYFPPSSDNGNTLFPAFYPEICRAWRKEFIFLTRRWFSLHFDAGWRSGVPLYWELKKVFSYIFLLRQPGANLTTAIGGNWCFSLHIGDFVFIANLVKTRWI